MNRIAIVAIFIFLVIIVGALCYRPGKIDTASIFKRNLCPESSTKTKDDTPLLPRMEFNFNMNQLLNDNSTQGSTAEISPPTQSQSHILSSAFLALLDVVIILMLLRYVLNKKSQ